MSYLNSQKAAWIWLILRVYVGYQWLQGGLGKLTNPKGFDASGFIKGAIAKAVPAKEGAKPIVQGWWANFLEGFALPNAELFSFMVKWGEFLIGLALILGVVTIFAAVMGMVMNFAFLLSGTVSSNPNYLIIQFLIVALGGAYAGYYGVDYWVRPMFRKLVSSIGGKAVPAGNS